MAKYKIGKPIEKIRMANAINTFDKLKGIDSTPQHLAADNFTVLTDSYPELTES